MKRVSDNTGLKGLYSGLSQSSLMGTVSETGSDVFKLQYFEGEAYLAQSPQFYKQMAQASGFEKVFSVGPVFRAEPSFTSRHMTEFTGWDFELSYINSHLDVMSEEENLLVSGFTQLQKTVLPDLEIPTTPFPQITMKEAKERLSKLGVKAGRKYDLSGEEEIELSRIIKEETGHDFVFVTDWPVEARPFLDMRIIGTLRVLTDKGLVTTVPKKHRYDVWFHKPKKKE